MRKKLLWLLLGLALFFTPLWPGHVLTLKVFFMQYACEPCADAEAFRVLQVYDPADHYLLHKDIILYYQGQYLRENNKLAYVIYDTVATRCRPVRMLGKLRRRSLFDKLAGTMYEADAYKVAYR